MLIELSSLQDERIAPYQELKTRRGTDPESFVVEGALLTQRLLQSDLKVVSLLVEEQMLERVQPWISNETPIYIVRRGMLSDVVGFPFHRGVVALGQRPIECNWRRIVEQFDRKAPLRVVMCANISNQDNMGAIIRNASAFGADLIIASKSGCDPYSRRATRSSMGTVFRLPVLELKEPLPEVLQQLREDYQVLSVASVLDASAQRLESLPPVSRFALVLGNEGDGLESSVIEACSTRATVPMQNETDSLNVAVAAGIFLYALTR